MKPAVRDMLDLIGLVAATAENAGDVDVADEMRAFVSQAREHHAMTGVLRVFRHAARATGKYARDCTPSFYRFRRVSVLRAMPPEDLTHAERVWLLHADMRDLLAKVEAECASPS